MNKRLKEIDFLYTLGTILVIFGHSHSSDWARIAGTPYEVINIFIYTFHMPLFFFVSGFLLMNSDRIIMVGYGKWIEEKALRIIVPYCLLTAIFLFPKMRMDTGLWIDPGYIVKAFLQPRSNVWGHLWFLPVLFLCFVIFGLWQVLVNKRNRLLWSIPIIVLTVVLYFLPLNIAWLGVTDFRSFALFFVFGIVAKVLINTNKIHLGFISKVLVIITGLVLSIFLYVFAYPNLFAKLGMALLMLVVCYITATLINENSFCTWVSKHNYTIYLYSWPAQAAVMMICDRFNTSWPITFLLMLVTGNIFPIFLILIYERVPKIHNRFFKLVLGVK